MGNLVEKAAPDGVSVRGWGKGSTLALTRYSFEYIMGA